MLPRAPSSPRYTVFIVLAWLVLLGYILVTGNTLGYVIIALMAVFVVLPTLVLFLLTRADRRQEQRLASPAGPQDEPRDERDTEAPHPARRTTETHAIQKLNGHTKEAAWDQLAETDPRLWTRN